MTARILVVDDIPANVKLLEVRLLAEYFEVLTASNGADALEICETGKIDVVLLDIMMPGMDGFEVCRRIKDDPTTHDIPVIFISAKSEVEDETRGLEVGAIDFITKPISPPIVKARVRNHLLLKRQTDLLRSLSFLDGLTGIANRRRFDDTMAREWRRCARSHLPLSLIILDVDHFKAYNDQYGHQAGDECLRIVAEVLAERARRPSDLVARYGGEEFVCLLPETDGSGATRVAEGFRAAVAERRIPHAQSPVAPYVTISLGVATVIPSVESSPDRLAEMADQLLYRAKRSGRNRVEDATVPAQ